MGFWRRALANPHVLSFLQPCISLSELPTVLIDSLSSHHFPSPSVLLEQRVAAVAAWCATADQKCAATSPAFLTSPNHDTRIGDVGAMPRLRKARVGGLRLRVICQRFGLFVSEFFPAVTNSTVCPWSVTPCG